jgi:importin subunit alpha-1
VQAEDIPALIRYLNTGDEPLQLEAVSQFRKMLSKEESPPINEVIANNLVPVFIRYLAYEANPRLQFEAAWALTNIASGTSANTKVVIEAGAVPMFAHLLDSTDPDVREQAVWALGNIAGDSPRCRDTVLRANALPGVLKHLVPGAKLSFVRNATWTLSNFLRGKPGPAYEAIADCLPMLARLIYSEDVDVLTDGLWALSYLTDGDDSTQLQQALEAGVATRVVELLTHPSNAVQTPALRTVGNIVTGDEIQTQVMINAGALPALRVVLTAGKKGLRKEACWAISNIMAGNREQVQAVIEAAVVPELVKLVRDGHHDIKKEACWALSNATSGGTPDQIHYMVEQEVVQNLMCTFTLRVACCCVCRRFNGSPLLIVQLCWSTRIRRS